MSDGKRKRKRRENAAATATKEEMITRPNESPSLLWAEAGEKERKKEEGRGRSVWLNKKMKDGLINCWIATDQKKGIGLSIFANDEADLYRGD